MKAMGKELILVPAITEAEFLMQVRQLARVLHWRDYHTGDSRRSPHGFPDLTLVSVRQRRIVFAELKSETGKVTPAQQEWISDLIEAGQEAYIWKPSEYEDIVAILKQEWQHFTEAKTEV